MKKRYMFIIAICAILSLLVSCDGSVNEMLFNGDDTEETPWPDPTFSDWVFQHADEDWTVTSTVTLDTDYVKKDDGFTFDGKVLRYNSKSEGPENIYINTEAQYSTIKYVTIQSPLNEYTSQ